MSSNQSSTARDYNCGDLLLLPKSHPAFPGHLIAIGNIFQDAHVGVSVIARQRGPNRERLTLSWLELCVNDLDQMRHRPAHRAPPIH